MRLRHNPSAKPELDAWAYFVADPETKKGKWHAAFTNTQPLHVELGCGKGSFLANLASHNPRTNFLALDMKNEVLVMTKRKVEHAYETLGLPIHNVLITFQNIEHIADILSAEDVADVLYINFPNPWPKGRHNKRRLTYPTQLQAYRTFLKDGGKIYFKTDDDDLFEDSLLYFKEAGFSIIFSSYNAHAEPSLPLDIRTEHEEKFAAQGIPIKYLVAEKLPL